MWCAPAVSVADDDTAQVLAEADNSRIGLWVFNDSDKALFLGIGFVPTTSLFNVKIAAGGFWEMPFSASTREIQGIWESDSTGAALVTAVI